MSACSGRRRASPRIGHASKANTVSKVLRPITSASTLAMKVSYPCSSPPPAGSQSRPPLARAMKPSTLVAMKTEAFTLVGFHPSAYRLHFLPIGAVQPRRRSAGHPAHHDELSAMVNQVMEQLAPEHVANRQPAAVEEVTGASS